MHQASFDPENVQDKEHLAGNSTPSVISNEGTHRSEFTLVTSHQEGRK